MIRSSAGPLVVGRGLATSSPLGLRQLQGLRLWAKASSGFSPASWANLADASSPLVQAVGAQQPSLVPNAVNGRPAAQFLKATAQTMSSTFTLGVKCTYFVVLKMLHPLGPSGVNDIVIGGLAIPATILAIDTTQTILFNGATLGIGAPSADGVFALVTCVFNAGSSLVQLNGATIAAGTDGGATTAPGGVSLASLSGARPVDVQVAELLVCDGVLPAAQLAAANRILVAEYAL